MTSIALEPARQPDIERLLRASDAAARALYAEEECFLLDIHELDRPGVSVYVARVDGTAVGMASLVGDELKRLFVDNGMRGRGVARRLLSAVENQARDAGARVIRLETGTLSTAAIALYEKAGFTHIPRFGPYVDSSTSVCMEKSLV